MFISSTPLGTPVSGPRQQVESKEREHMFLVSTNLLQDSIGKDHVYFNRADYMSVGQDMIQT